MKNEMFFLIAKIYALLYLFIKKIFKINIRGFGFFLRQIKNPKVIKYKNKKLFFNPKVASSYGLHIIGLSQEKQTELFLDRLMEFFTRNNESVSFVDIGSNIGIFLLQIAKYPRTKVIGFEPSKECIKATEKTFKLNDLTNYELYCNLVGSENSEVYYSYSTDPQGASVYTSSNDKSNLIKQIRLDENESIKKIHIDSKVILLIDVEGYEPEVFKGAINLIDKFKPLIIFEYNKKSKLFYNIKEIKSLLGNKWIIYRQRKDTLLDMDIENAWNCIAFHIDSEYENLFKNLSLFA